MSQERMRNPFGLILKRLGQKPAQTHLFDPNRTKLEIRLGRQCFLLFALSTAGWDETHIERFAAISNKQEQDRISDSTASCSHSQRGDAVSQ